MIAAYIFIHTEVGVVGSVAAEVAEIKGVTSAEGLTRTRIYKVAGDLEGVWQ
jgi:hypothetical protein